MSQNKLLDSLIDTCLASKDAFSTSLIKFHLDFIQSLGHNAVIKAVPLSSSYGFRPGHLSVFRGIKVVFALFGLMSVGLTSGLKSVALK